MNKKYTIYYFCLLLLSMTSATLPMWRQFTRRVQSVTPTISEAYQVFQRDKGNLEKAATNLYQNLSKLNKYRNEDFGAMSLLNNPQFLQDLSSAARSVQETKNAAIQLKKITEEVKGETWQQGLVEEPAGMSEITLDEDNYLIVDQPKAPQSKTIPCELHENGEWEVLGDFETEDDDGLE